METQMEALFALPAIAAGLIRHWQMCPTHNDGTNDPDLTIMAVAAITNPR